MANNLSLVILAGGMGSRYKGQKQIVLIGPHGESLMEYSIFDAFSIGIQHFVFIINQQFDFKTKKYFQQIIERNGGNVEFILQTTYTAVSRSIYDKIEQRQKPWGTGHALLIAKSHLTNPFIVIDSTDFYGHKAFQKAKEMVLQELILANRYGMIAYNLAHTLNENETISREICKVKNKFLQNVTTHSSISKNNDGIVEYMEKNSTIQMEVTLPVSMNFWVLHPSIFRSLEEQFKQFLQKFATDLTAEFYLSKVINGMIKEDQLEVMVRTSNEQWFGITYPEDKQYVKQSIEQLIERQKYPKALWK